MSHLRHVVSFRTLLLTLTLTLRRVSALACQSVQNAQGFHHASGHCFHHANGKCFHCANGQGHLDLRGSDFSNQSCSPHVPLIRTWSKTKKPSLGMRITPSPSLRPSLSLSHARSGTPSYPRACRCWGRGSSGACRQSSHLAWHIPPPACWGHGSSGGCRQLT